MRAKRVIRDRRLPYEVPEGDELAARLPAVLAVVYLVFNEGYAAHTGEALVRHDLCDEALRLGEILAELMRGEPEVLGLLALMELQASRAAARTDADGNLVLLADQDRSRWDRARIARGLAYLDRAGTTDGAGAYRLQAAIAACHARAPSWEETDWRRIVAHYRALAAGRAVAGRGAEPRGGDRPRRRGRRPGSPPSTGSTRAALRDYHLLPAARADFLRRLGRHAEAAGEYRRALDLADNPRERAFLAARLAACESTGDLQG